MAAVAALVGGLALLSVAADRFVEGAAGIALRLRLPAVIVGAVILGFGTSAPELLVSAFAAANGARDIAIGNIVGSNVANLTLVLGVVAVIAVPTISSGVLLREAPLTAGAMALLAVLLDPLTRLDGLVLLVVFIVVMVAVVRMGGRTDDELGREAAAEFGEAAHDSWRRLGLLTGGGLLGTVLGAQLLVSGARTVAEAWGLGEGLVGFTLVAVGTSLPELVTGIQAARRREAELAIGNVLGSNLFNSLLIAGTVGLVGPGDVSGGLVAAAGVMVAVGFATWLLMWTARRLQRWEGAVLVAGYVATVPLVV